MATSSPAWPGQPYPVRPVESVPGTQTLDTRHQGAIDGARVRAVLMDLARLKGCNLAKVSLDSVKCLDIIPQAVVLWVVWELAMDQGTLRALAAMYGKPRCAFRLAGSLTEWRRAANGILPGCPLIVVLIDHLTSIWKTQIEDMCKHVAVPHAA